MELMMRKRKLDYLSNLDFDSMTHKELLDICNDLNMTTEANKLKGMLDNRGSLTDKAVSSITNTFREVKDSVINSITLSINNYTNALKEKYISYFNNIEELEEVSQDKIKRFEENYKNDIELPDDTWESITKSYKSNEFHSTLLRHCATLSKDFENKAKGKSFVFHKANEKIYKEYDSRFYNIGSGDVMICLSKEDFKLGTLVDSSVFQAFDLAPKFRNQTISFKDINVDKKTLLYYLDKKRVKKDVDSRIADLRSISKSLEMLIDDSISKKTTEEVKGYKSYYDYIHEKMYMEMKYSYRAIKSAMYLVDKFSKPKKGK